MLIPIVTIPLSLIGAGHHHAALGFSLNLLTLLAMVLAIGLVVDDAIVVVENVYRHIEEGKTPAQAALIGAREIAGPVIAMTLTLAAVYAPIGFLGGVTGTLFREFAFTLAGAVIISGIVAVTLSPMMCSLLLTPRDVARALRPARSTAASRASPTPMAGGLQRSLDYRPVTALFALAVFVSARLHVSQHQDGAGAAGRPGRAVRADQGAAIRQSRLHATPTARSSTRRSRSIPETDAALCRQRPASDLNQGIAGVILKPWGERKRSALSRSSRCCSGWSARSTGLQAFVFSLPPLPGTRSAACRCRW